jgi:hypothetical protein
MASFTDQEPSMNFAAIVKALSLIPSILPVIGAFVAQADSLLASAPGASKFASVLAAVNAYIVKLESDVNVIAELKSLVEPLIEGAVAFAHAPSTTAAVAAPLVVVPAVVTQVVQPAAVA